jgi:transcription initiation factor TFIIIB Brf1 subunit/transcription initiation factor TFIIB
VVLEERMIMDDYAYNVSWCKDSHEQRSYWHSYVEEAPRHVVPDRIAVRLDGMLARLHLDNSIVATTAHGLLKIIKQHLTFRDTMMNAALACCIYLACMQTKTGRIPRSAEEIYGHFMIDNKTFYKALKEVHNGIPQQASSILQRYSEKDSVIRQLEQLHAVPLERIHEVVNRVAYYNTVRMDMRYMLATPPTTINAVLIVLACDDLDIAVEKKQMVNLKWASIVTMNKHLKSIREFVNTLQT